MTAGTGITPTFSSITVAPSYSISLIQGEARGRNPTLYPPIISNGSASSLQVAELSVRDVTLGCERDAEIELSLSAPTDNGEIAP